MCFRLPAFMKKTPSKKNVSLQKNCRIFQNPLPFTNLLPQFSCILQPLRLCYIYHRQAIHHPYTKPQASLSLSPPHSLAMATLKASVLLSDISKDEGHLGSGAIHVITGPMFSGKSTSLLRRIKTEISVGR